MVDEPVIPMRDRLAMVREEGKTRKDDPLWTVINAMSLTQIDKVMGSAATKRGIIRKLAALNRSGGGDELSPTSVPR